MCRVCSCFKELIKSLYTYGFLAHGLHPRGFPGAYSFDSVESYYSPLHKRPRNEKAKQGISVENAALIFPDDQKRPRHEKANPCHLNIAALSEAGAPGKAKQEVFAFSFRQATVSHYLCFPGQHSLLNPPCTDCNSPPCPLTSVYLSKSALHETTKRPPQTAHASIVTEDRCRG